MTIREKLQLMCYERGMFEDTAIAVVTRYLESPAGEAMRARADDDVVGYPEMLINVLWLGLKTEAVAYIDKNEPQAWYRPVFAK